MRNKDSIPLSPTHGVNPSLGQCFWCGEQNGTVLLLGRLPNDQPAPYMVVMDYEPCNACKKKFAMGVTLVEVTDTPLANGQRPFGTSGAYPTGRLVVVTPDSILRIFQQPMADLIVQNKSAIIDPEVFELLMRKPAEAEG